MRWDALRDVPANICGEVGLQQQRWQLLLVLLACSNNPIPVLSCATLILLDQWMHSSGSTRSGAVLVNTFRSRFASPTVLIRIWSDGWLYGRVVSAEAAYSYRSFFIILCVSVCVCIGPSMSINVSYGKRAEQISMPFGVIVRVGPRTCRMNGGADRPTVTANWGLAGWDVPL